MDHTYIDKLMEEQSYGFIEVPKVEREMAKNKPFELIQGIGNHLTNIDNNYIDRMIQQQKKIKEMSENIFIKEEIENGKKKCKKCNCKECEKNVCMNCNCEDCEKKKEENKEKERKKMIENEKNEMKKENFVNIGVESSNMILYGLTGIVLLILIDKLN